MMSASGDREIVAVSPHNPDCRPVAALAAKPPQASAAGCPVPEIARSFPSDRLGSRTEILGCGLEERRRRPLKPQAPLTSLAAIVPIVTAISASSVRHDDGLAKKALSRVAP